MTVPPVRPVDVVVLHVDGSVMPVEPVYVGLDDRGMHVWEVITPVCPGDRVRVGVLPARTSIVFGDPSDG